MKIRFAVIAALLLAAVLFVPIPRGTYDDGGTREYTALTYRIVDWNRLYDDGSGNGPSVYEKLRIYGPTDRAASIDVLWARESARFGKRGETYDGEWMEKSDRTKDAGGLIGHIRITEIYANCFFASSVVPMPYEIKLNGKLSSDWCVGDQVFVTYENLYYDADTGRIEADFLTVEPSDFELRPGVAYKPVIYLYPETETDVSVKLNLNGRLTCTYPVYDNGWTVTASPDGVLTDRDGREYDFLFWEGELNAAYDFSRGFCVSGENTAAFLEDALARLGLTDREATEFIVYWLPLMQENPYNLIAFQTDAYTDAARLEVSPVPDTLIRVFMAFRASEEYVPLAPQTLSSPERDGFCVVEWGGTELK